MHRGVRFARALGVALALLALAVPAAAARVTDVRVGQHPGFTRIVFETDAPVRYRMERTASGALEVVLGAEADAERIASAGTLLRSVEIESRGRASVARLTLRGDSVAVQELVLSKPSRIVIDLRPQTGTPSAGASTEKARASAKPGPGPSGKTPSPTTRAAATPTAKTAQSAKSAGTAKTADTAKLPAGESAASAKAPTQPGSTTRSAAESAAADAKQALAVGSRTAGEAAQAAGTAAKQTGRELAADADAAKKALSGTASDAASRAGTTLGDAASTAKTAVADAASAAKTKAAEAAALAAKAGEAAGSTVAKAGESAGSKPTQAPEPGSPIARRATTLTDAAHGSARDAGESAADRARRAAETARSAAAAKPAPADAATKSTAEPSGFLPGFLKSPVVLSAVGLLVIIFGAVAFARRRQSEDEEFATPFASDEPFDLEGGEEAAERTVAESAVAEEAASEADYAGSDFQAGPETAIDSNDLSEAPVASKEGDPVMEQGLEGIERSMETGYAPAAAGGVSDDVMRIVQQLENRVGALEKRLEEVSEAKERLERQVAAQTEELRVQRSAIARTQRALRSLAKPGDEATEPVPKG